MKKIIPHLWFDTQAKEAAEFYASAFKSIGAPDSHIQTVSQMHNTPSGDADIVSFELAGQEFMAISAGPYFKFTPAVSFLVTCKTKEEVDTLWNAFIKGGGALMELGSYPFSERYGWLADTYGLTWQFMYAGDRPVTQKIKPVMMFINNNLGKATEAIKFYTSVFHNSSVGDAMPHGPDVGKPGMIAFGQFTLEAQEFAAMDGVGDHKFNFNEAISFLINCDTQEEIDYYWKKLSAVPEAEQCGWLKDKFGFSWQVNSSKLQEMLTSKDQAAVERVTQAFLKMKKFDIAKLQQAYQGK
jgi:predicted 3-demethylubiquinone-9 3-methyltransferase (glyoxalase superfamily)